MLRMQRAAGTVADLHGRSNLHMTPVCAPKTRGQRRMGALVPCCSQGRDTEARTPLSTLMTRRQQENAQSASSSDTDVSCPSDGEEAVQWAGYADIVAVSMLWGTYNPTLKLIYLEENPLDPSTLTAIRTLLSAGALISAVAWQVASQGGSAAVHGVQGSGMARADDDDGIIVRNPDRVGPLAYSFAGMVPAGIELGIYNFMGTASQAIGLQLTSATRASFLVQLTAVLVPVLSFLAGEKVSSRVWSAVALGLAGSFLVAFDGILHSGAEAGGSTNNPEELKGILFIVISCVCYSLATIRLGIYAPKFNSIDLTAVKKITLSAISFGWFLLSAHGSSSGDQSLVAELSELGITGRSAASYALVMFSALGPGAGATFLQTRGQAKVPATAAQVIYSLTPIWGAVFAQVLLGDEGLGPLSWLGGAGVLAASLMAAQAQTASADRSAGKEDD